MHLHMHLFVLFKKKKIIHVIYAREHGTHKN